MKLILIILVSIFLLKSILLSEKFINFITQEKLFCSKKFIFNGYEYLFIDNKNTENVVLEFQGNRNFKFFLTISFLTILFCILYIISIFIFVIREKYKKKKYI